MSPLYIFPVVPSSEIKSPSWNVYPPSVNSFASSSIAIAPQPDTQHVPMPLATTAAWDVIPPRTVRIPCAACIPSISSGDVSRRTRMTRSFLFSFTSRLASSAVNTILPAAAPGEAGSASPITSPAFKASVSNVGCSTWSSDFASILSTASCGVIFPSSTKSHAIRIAACAVRLPLRVCKKYSFPSSMVNSISCISR